MRKGFFQNSYIYGFADRNLIGTSVLIHGEVHVKHFHLKI